MNNQIKKKSKQIADKYNDYLHETLFDNYNREIGIGDYFKSEKEYLNSLSESIEIDDNSFRFNNLEYDIDEYLDHLENCTNNDEYVLDLLIRSVSIYRNLQELENLKMN